MAAEDRLAILSVSDKTNIVNLATELSQLGVKLLASGGTAKLLRQNNIPVQYVSYNIIITNNSCT